MMEILHARIHTILQWFRHIEVRQKLCHEQYLAPPWAQSLHKSLRLYHKVGGGPRECCGWGTYVELTKFTKLTYSFIPPQSGRLRMPDAGGLVSQDLKLSALHDARN